MLPHVQGRSDFVVAKKDGYTVIDYVYADKDTFDHPIRRECRGLKFGPDGRLIARPFHKFFNLGEKSETTAVDWSRPHRVYTKLDGSMVHPAIVSGRIVFMTRMGVTDVAQQAQAYAWHCFSELDAPQYMEFAHHCIEQGLTPIFEWTAPYNRIVVPYDEEKLTLLAIRDNETGEYLDINTPEVAAFGIPTARRWLVRENPRDVDVRDLIEEIRALQGEEGVVVHFDAGLFIKIKADEYVQFHRAKDACSSEKRILPLVLENKIDDLLPLLSPQDRAELEEYATTVNRCVGSSAEFAQRAVAEFRERYGEDRKMFATSLRFAGGFEALKPVVFRIYDGADPREALVSVLLKHCSTNTKIDGIRELIGGATWRAVAPDEH